MNYRSINYNNEDLENYVEKIKYDFNKAFKKKCKDNKIESFVTSREMKNILFDTLCTTCIDKNTLKFSNKYNLNQGEYKISLYDDIYEFFQNESILSPQFFERNPEFKGCNDVGEIYNKGFQGVFQDDDFGLGTFFILESYAIQELIKINLLKYSDFLVIQNKEEKQKYHDGDQYIVCGIESIDTEPKDLTLYFQTESEIKSFFQSIVDPSDFYPNRILKIEKEIDVRYYIG